MNNEGFRQAKSTAAHGNLLDQVKPAYLI